MLKRSMAALLAAAMVMSSLAGCSGSGNSADPAGSADSGKETASQAVPEGTESGSDAGRGTGKRGGRTET